MTERPPAAALILLKCFVDGFESRRRPFSKDFTRGRGSDHCRASVYFNHFTTELKYFSLVSGIVFIQPHKWRGLYLSVLSADGSVQVKE